MPREANGWTPDGQQCTCQGDCPVATAACPLIPPRHYNFHRNRMTPSCNSFANTGRRPQVPVRAYRFQVCRPDGPVPNSSDFRARDRGFVSISGHLWGPSAIVTGEGGRERRRGRHRRSAECDKALARGTRHRRDDACRQQDATRYRPDEGREIPGSRPFFILLARRCP